MSKLTPRLSTPVDRAAGAKSALSLEKDAIRAASDKYCCYAKKGRQRDFLGCGQTYGYYQNIYINGNYDDLNCFRIGTIAY